MEERDGVPEAHNFSFLYCPRLTSFISTYSSLVKRSFQTQSFPVAFWRFCSSPENIILWVRTKWRESNRDQNCCLNNSTLAPRDDPRRIIPALGGNDWWIVMHCNALTQLCDFWSQLGSPEILMTEKRFVATIKVGEEFLFIDRHFPPTPHVYAD